MRTFQLHILAADRVFFEGECDLELLPHGKALRQRLLSVAQRRVENNDVVFRGHSEFSSVSGSAPAAAASGFLSSEARLAGARRAQMVERYSRRGKLSRKIAKPIL